MSVYSWRSLPVVLWTLLAGFGVARADWYEIPLGSAVTITVDEYGHGTAAWDGVTVELPWRLMQDTGPGGLPGKLTYSLLEPEELLPGDVWLFDNSNVLRDIIRFNFDVNDLSEPGTLVFYGSCPDSGE